MKVFQDANKDKYLIRILFPSSVDDRIINSYSEIANVRVFERKIKDNNIIIVPDYTNLLVAYITDPIKHDKETSYFVSYSDNEKIAYI